MLPLTKYAIALSNIKNDEQILMCCKCYTENDMWSECSSVNSERLEK